MVEQINSVCASFHEHINITTKLQNDQSEESSEVQANRSTVTKDIKKKPYRDWQEGQRCQMCPKPACGS